MGFARAPLRVSRILYSIRVVRGGRAGTPSSPYFCTTGRVPMRFTVRSLGGKLIISAALTLLLCMVLFAATSSYLLKIFYEHQATTDARAHLASIKESYDER